MAATMLSMQTSRLAAGAARAAKPAGVTSSSVAAPRAAGVVARAEKQNLWYPGTCEWGCSIASEGWMPEQTSPRTVRGGRVL